MSRVKDSVAERHSQESPGPEPLRPVQKRTASVAGNLLARHWYVFLPGAILGVLYTPVLKALVINWVQDPDYGHGFLVPVFAGYALWRSRRRWQNLTPEPSNFGLPVILFGIALLIVGSLGAELFLTRASLLVILAGMVLYLFGGKTLFAVAFPLSYLVFMIPLPTIMYNQLTFPLQLAASRLAAGSLDAVQVPVLREGNLLILPNQTLEVVEACSGIRSLMSLFALAITYSYLAESRAWARLTVAALMLPVAVLSNAFRIFGAGVFTYLLGAKWAEGFFHTFSGWLVFVTALVGMLLAHWLVKHAIVYVGKRLNA
jgi:exosortase